MCRTSPNRSAVPVYLQNRSWPEETGFTLVWSHETKKVPTLTYLIDWFSLVHHVDQTSNCQLFHPIQRSPASLRLIINVTQSTRLISVGITSENDVD